MSDIDEGSNFLSAFKDRFGSKERTTARAKAERRAGMTPKQRARIKGPPKTQKNFRASAETIAQLKALVAHTGQNETDEIVAAIAARHKKLLGDKG
jgi:hypothetical protein